MSNNNSKNILDKEFLRDYRNQLLLELYIAYQEARLGGKRATVDVNRFEVNDMENLMILTDDLLNKRYKPSPGVAHIIHNPVIREIFAAPFRDRVIHHWIYDKIYDWFDRHFIYDSYSCRLEKGTLLGIKRLDHHIRTVSHNYAVETWVIQMDIQGYFMSLPRKRVLEKVMVGVDQIYADKRNSKEYELLKYALAQVVLDDPTQGVVRRGWPDAWRDLPPEKSMFAQPPGHGLVIGNLTSQLLSNVYLDALDRYITFDLGYKHYGRYVDDFYIVITKDQLAQALKDIAAIRSFLQREGLNLHPRKTKVQKIQHGVAFLGAVVYPGAILPGKRLKHNYYKAYDEYKMNKKGMETLMAYKGQFCHFKSPKILSEILCEYECIN